MDSPKTIFCDIDGTILQHTGDIISNITEPPVLLKNVIENIKQWEKNNYKIILITGRKECLREITHKQLLTCGIVYDELIMNLPNGYRILINDKKPINYNNTAYAINVVRNTGFENLDLTSQNITISDNYLYEKIEKPWGYEELIECNDKYEIGRAHV